MRILNNGQSILEYIILATIVIVAIVVGGPSLVRGVQSYFKMVDESVQDAAGENIDQGPIPGVGEACTVTAWTPGECGVGFCKATQRYSYRTARPMKCANEELCTPDPSCCTMPEPVSCGTKFDPSVLSNTFPSKTCFNPRNALKPQFSADFSGTCVPGGGDTSIDCSVGERLYKIECANTVNPLLKDTFYGCKKNAETDLNCLPSCWEYPYPGSLPCNDPANPEADINMVDENALTENDLSVSIPQRKQLIDEVTYRQKTVPDTTLAIPTNSGDLSASPHDTTADTHNPYRPITKNTYQLTSENTDITNPLKYNSYRVNYVYLQTSQCSPIRFCERVCPSSMFPSPEGYLGLHENETCIPCSTLPAFTSSGPDLSQINGNTWRFGNTVDRGDNSSCLTFSDDLTINMPSVNGIDVRLISAMVDDHMIVSVNGTQVLSIPTNSTDPCELDYVWATGLAPVPAINNSITQYLHPGNNTLNVKNYVGNHGFMLLDIQVIGNFCANP